MILHKAQRVEPLGNFTLLAIFRNQEQKEYDVKPLFKKWDVFLPLEGHKEHFDQVRVGVGGYGISWNDDIDLSCDDYISMVSSNLSRTASSPKSVEISPCRFPSQQRGCVG